MKLRTLKQLPSVVLMFGLFAVFISYLDNYLEARQALPFLNVTMFLWSLAAMTAGSVVRAAASPRLMRLASAFSSLRVSSGTWPISRM